MKTAYFKKPAARAALALLIGAAATSVCSAQEHKAPAKVPASNVLPSLSDAGQWQLVNNGGPQVQIERQGAIDVATYTGTVTTGDGRITAVDIQPIKAVPLVEGQVYKLSYDIRGDELRDVLTIVQTVGKDRPNFYLSEKKHSFGVGYQHCEDTFTAIKLFGRPVLVEFCIGDYEGPVYLQNVTLQAITPTPKNPPKHG